MIDKAAVTHLIGIADRLDVIASRFKAAKYWLSAQYAEGISCFAGWEAVERWEYANDVRLYVLKHSGNIPSIGAVPSVPLKSESIHHCLVSLLKQDESAAQDIRDTIKTLFATNNYAAAIFLSGLLERIQKDLKEVAEVVDHTGPKAPVPLLYINDILSKKYDKSYRK